MLSVISLYTLRFPAHGDLSVPPEELKIEKVNVALTETGAYHDEVVAALYYTIGSIPGANTSMYLARTRFGIQSVYSWIQQHHNLSSYSISSPDQFQPNDTITPAPDVIVLTTCEVDIHTLAETLRYHFEHGSQTLVCVIHHADRFGSVDERIRPWAGAERLRIITLAKHTAIELRKQIDEKFDGDLYESVSIDVLPPVFQAPLDPPRSDYLSIAIQGNLDPDRRSYNQTFKDFERLIDRLPDPLRSRMCLIIVGSGHNIDIPEKLQPYISQNKALDYIPYYNLLHESFALIPAFADEDYYKTKASSSIPAGFIANVPIMGSRRLSDAYGYLSQDSMWLMGDAKMSEMETISEILNMHFDDKGMEKDSWASVVEGNRQAVKSRAEELMRENRRLMRDIVWKALL